MPYSIMLDAGHGGQDPGAVYQGRQEKDDALALTLAVGEKLQENGVDVQYTRTTDVYESPFQKAEEANQADADFFVSIHRNSFPSDNGAAGVESLVFDLSGIKYEMAQNINSQLEAAGFADLGIQPRPGLVVLKKTKMPAVLIEVGFVNSDEDNKLLDSSFANIVHAITAGILDTLADAGAEEEPYYTVQAGTFRNQNNAGRLLDELLEQDFPAYLDASGPYMTVRVGSYQDLEEAAEMERKLKQAGYAALLLSGSM